MSQSVWLISLVAAMAIFQLAAVPALFLKKNDLADVAWGPTFLLAYLAAAHWGTGLPQLDQRGWLVLVLLTIWSARLFVHVGWRNLTHRAEDVRYNNWRKQWGSTWLWRSYLQVFVLQPLILYVFLLPATRVLAGPSEPLGPLAWAGLAIWTIGFLFEAISDEQLRLFKKNPANKGKLMTSGLWAWSRHPNYFGEVTLWWGLWLIALELPGGWATVLGPMGVTYLILKVSGVSMLEGLMHKRPGYAEYAKRTPAFFPWPPRQ